MQHLKAGLMVALVCFVVIAAVNRVDFLKKIAYPVAG